MKVFKNHAVGTRCIPAAVLLLFSAVMTGAAAASEVPAAVTKNGLYLTDDHQYGVYVLHDDPDAVGIAEYYGQSQNQETPGTVVVGGHQIPVHAVADGLGTAKPAEAGTYPGFLPLPADNDPLRQETLDLTNEIRAAAGKSALVRSAELDRAAMVRAVEMAAADEMSHTRPDGSDFSTVLDGYYGYAYGENIIMPGVEDPADAPASAVDWWKNSPPHYANLTSDNFTAMGCAYALSKSGVWYGSQLFAAPDGQGVPKYDTVKLKAPYTPDAQIVDPLAVPLQVKDVSWGRAVTGLSAAFPTTAGEAAEKLRSQGDSPAFFDDEGRPLGTDETVATGFEARFGEENTATVVVTGDVCGTGKMSLSQLVMLSQALGGRTELEGPYLAAGDHNGSGSIDLSDLVAEARMLQVS